MNRTYLMCPPTHFAVSYCINPWMCPDGPVDAARAMRQWERLRGTLVALGHTVHAIGAHPDLPDMVFTANAGLVIGGRALVSRFRHPERAAESAHFAAAFSRLGIPDVSPAAHVNEGQGDFLLTRHGILAGTGFRSDPRAADEVREIFGLPVLPLNLVDPRFYHLDTALAVLSEDAVAYWPGAFDTAGRALLRDLFPDAVLAGETDAGALALNMVSDGTTVIMPPGRPRLAQQIRDRGFRVVRLPTDELRKAGGGAKCCVLELHPAAAAAAPAPGETISEAS